MEKKEEIRNAKVTSRIDPKRKARTLWASSDDLGQYNEPPVKAATQKGSIDFVRKESWPYVTRSIHIC